jgi:nucleoside 2-deoxyribosyltransferase
MPSSYKKPKQIRIAIGYGWSGKKADKGKGGLTNHWSFLREEVKSVISTVYKLSEKRTAPLYPLDVDSSRLRARHGMGALGGILNKIKQSDILIFDITGHNPNVLFELGYALAVKGVNSGQVFIFHQETKGKKQSVPSDLTAFMRTEYRLASSFKTKKASTNKNVEGKDKNLCYAKLKDSRGFKASLRGKIIEIAKKRSMWV